jgi:biotin transport system substrate-specific component
MTLSISNRPSLIDQVFPRSLATDATLILLGAAVTALAAQVAIPLWPVPITGQTFAVLLVGAVLGATRGAISMLAYITFGAIGLPVFTAAGSGITFGATFGYIVGFVAAAAVVGWFAQLGWQKKVFGVVGSFLIGNLVIYAFGLPWLAFVLGNLGANNGIQAVASAGLIPFLVGDAIKIALAAAALPLAWKMLGKK